MTVYTVTPPPRAPSFTKVRLDDLETASVPAPRFVIDGIAPRKEPTLLTGHGGSGKSLLALNLAAHVATGRGWGPFSCVMGEVVFLSMEDRAEVVRYRLKKICDQYDLDPEDVAKNLTVLDGTESEALAVETMTDGIRHVSRTDAFEELAEACKGADLVIIDNASDAFDADENNRRQVRQFMRGMVGKIARDEDCAVIVLAHVDKVAARFGGNGNTYSGSTAWHNSARSRLALVEQDGVPQLVQEKSTHQKISDPVAIRWTDGGVLVPAGGADVHVVDDRAEQDDAGVLAAMRAAAEADVVVPPGRSGPATAFTVLKTFDALPEQFSARGGRERFWRAMSRLQRGNSVVSEEYRDSHRHAKKRLVLRQCGNAAIPLIPPALAAAGGAAAAMRASSETAAHCRTLPQTDEVKAIADRIRRQREAEGRT